jgi:hypothetical protein
MSGFGQSGRDMVELSRSGCCRESRGMVRQVEGRPPRQGQPGYAVTRHGRAAKARNVLGGQGRACQGCLAMVGLDMSWMGLFGLPR